MAAVANKKYAGQSAERNTGSSDRQEEPYVVTGATDLADAVAAVLAKATLLGEDTITSGGVTLYQLGVSVDFVAEAAAGGSSIYNLTLHYGPQSAARMDLGKVKVTYDTSGGTIHTTLAKTEAVYDHAGLMTGTNAADFHLVIGNQEDSADGCDIPVSDFHMTVTVVFDANATVGTAHAMPAPGDVFWTTGKTNDAAFAVKDSFKLRTYSFLAGELIFEGASEPDPRPDGNIEMTFKFHGSPNVTNQTIGTGATAITGVDKKGSEYLWVRYEKKDNAVKKITTLTPKYAIVNQVVYTADFSLLCIPVPP
jgi:hypothetical protein